MNFFGNTLVSSQTICHWFFKGGLRNCKPTRVPMLTMEYQQQICSWLQFYLNFYVCLPIQENFMTFPHSTLSALPLTSIEQILHIFFSQEHRTFSKMTWNMKCEKDASWNVPYKGLPKTTVTNLILQLVTLRSSSERNESDGWFILLPEQSLISWYTCF